MKNTDLVVSPRVHEAIASFISNTATLSLPLNLLENEIQAQPEIPLKGPNGSFQRSLNQLDDVLDTRTPLYLLLRRDASLFAITYIPYLAKEAQRTAFLRHRHELLRHLGENLFSSSLICKEIGEITDARSWDEREKHGQLANDMERKEACESREASGKPCTRDNRVQDLGYIKNKCRLCDRRMKNKIDEQALEALGNLESAGSCVQISVNVTTEVLTLNFHANDVPPGDIAKQLPPSRPSFTFYRHPETKLLYFIFCSPDSASVQERMKHTMSIPGLVNVHARDSGVCVDQKLEIHDPEDLVFEDVDARIGKFRSVYLRNRFDGTESVYASMVADKAFLDAVV